MSIDRLYKYGRLSSFSEQLFSSGTIWFANPSELNDPFECRPLINFDATDEQRVKAVAESLRRYPGFTEEAAVVEANRLFRVGRLNDPARWNALRADVLREASRVGVYCLSCVSDSVLMWSHYAQEHQGYCLEFAATDHTAVFGTAQQVTYSDGYPTIDYFRSDHRKQVEFIFLTKYAGWAYEQEWRIIDYRTGPGLKAYPPELLKRVIFGLRMPEDDKARIRTWVARRCHSVKFYQAGLHERKFSIELRKIGS